MLGPSPQPTLAEYPLDVLAGVYEVNVVAPVGLVQLALPLLRASGGTIVNVTSDAAVEGYEGWGGYGSSKAALEQVSNVLAAEEPDLRVYWFDPGDMRTAMHQEAFPGEDISDRPEPETVVPALRRLLAERPPSGRFRAAELLAEAGDEPGCALPAASAAGPGRPAPLRPARRRSRQLSHPRPGASPGTRCGCSWPAARRASSCTDVRATCPTFLDPGDLVVVNTSATIPAAVDAVAPDGTHLVVHFSTRIDGTRWVVEPRRREGPTTVRWQGELPDHVMLPPDGRLEILEPYLGSCRLWVADARPAVAGPHLARPPRPPDPVPLRRASMAAVGLPERVRQRAWERGDAERRPAVHRRRRHPPGRQGRRRRAPGAPHRRRLARSRRAAVPRAGPGAGGDG